MAQNIMVIVYPVRDAGKARTFYSRFLETEPYVDSPYYIGYKAGNMEVGLDPHSRIGPIAYIDVKDIRYSIQAMVEAGAQVVQDAVDVGGGLLIARVKDTDGNVVGFRQQT